MDEPNDVALLRRYAEAGDEDAFARLVTRKVGLVYSAALRWTRDPHKAEDIVQAVFILLGRRAETLGGRENLSGWLYETTRLTAANYVRSEIRRARREEEAGMQPPDDNADKEHWSMIAPMLEPALGDLSEKDRAAIVLRYFEGKSLREVGGEMGTNEAAAKMRVGRALDKLRRGLAKRGVLLPLAAIIGAVSARAIAAAPPEVARRAVAATTHGAIATPFVAALVNATLRTLLWRRGLKVFGLSAAALLVSAGLATLSLGNAQPEAAPAVAATPVPERQGAAALQPREPFTREALFTLNTPVGAVAVQQDGKVLAGSTLGGFFVDPQSGMLGWYSRGVIRLEADGNLDRSFHCEIGRPEASSAMAARVMVLGDKVFLSGLFDHVDNESRYGHALLLADGQVDAGFDPWGGGSGLSPRIDASRITYSSAQLSDGSVAVISRSGYEWSAVRLDATGKPQGPVSTNSGPDMGRPGGLILNYSDLPLGPFPEVPLELVKYAVRLPEGGAAIAVRDRPINGMMRHGHIQRFHRDWRLDPGFTNEFEASGQSEISLHAQKDGKILVAGMIGKMNGDDFPGLVRLERDGSIDRGFRCETGNSLEGRVMDLAIQKDGRMVIVGFFTQVNGEAREHIARISAAFCIDGGV